MARIAWIDDWQPAEASLTWLLMHRMASFPGAAVGQSLCMSAAQATLGLGGGAPWALATVNASREAAVATVARVWNFMALQAPEMGGQRAPVAMVLRPAPGSPSLAENEVLTPR